MKIAVTHKDGKVFQHFGHTEQFKVYNVSDQKVVSSEVVSTNGQGHGALADVLKQIGADVLICGGIGGGAQNALTQVGIKFFGGVSGDCDEAVKAYIAGTLRYNPDVKCNHHEGEHKCGGHDHTHTCGGHCGEHK